MFWLYNSLAGRIWPDTTREHLFMVKVEKKLIGSLAFASRRSATAISHSDFPFPFKPILYLIEPSIEAQDQDGALSSRLRQGRSANHIKSSSIVFFHKPETQQSLRKTL